MKNLFKIAIRIVPVFAILVLAYILYLNFYGDRNYNNWFGSRKYADIKTESKKANRIFLEYDRLILDLNKTNTFPDISENGISKNIIILDNFLTDSLKSLNSEFLDSISLFNFFVCQKDIENRIYEMKYNHFYLLNPFDGKHVNPYLILKNYEINNKNDISKYLDILSSLPNYIDDLNAAIQKSEKNQTLPPKFILQKAKEDCYKLISGQPFSNNYTKSLVLKDFEEKSTLLDLDYSLKKKLIDSCNIILKTLWEPAYTKLISKIKNAELKALNSPSISVIEKGEDYYSFLLKKFSNTILNAEEIYNIGIEEIKKTKDSLKLILGKENISDYLEKLRYTNKIDDKDLQKEIYSRFLNSKIFTKCSSLFIKCPDSLELKLPTISEQLNNFNKIIFSKDKLFINKYVPSLPIVFKESILALYIFPGDYYLNKISHHNNFHFRENYSGIEAYKEGWRLYSLELALETGLLQNTESKIGKFLTDLHYCTHLIVDIGIHYKNWTREQAFSFYKQNTALDKLSINEITNKIISYPASFIAPIIGKLSIIELRKKSQKALSEKFDLKEFHDVITRNGPLPIDLLEDQVDNYILNYKSKK